jgi:hypothetical protein
VSVSSPSKGETLDVSAKKRAVNLPQPDRDGAAAEVWDEYFAKNKPSVEAVGELVSQLSKQRKHDEVEAVINAALLHGRSQPWMYEVLALTLEIQGRPKAEIERAMLSGIDFSTVSTGNMIYSAAYLTRFGLKSRALQLYRQAANLDPNAPEPYAMGLKLAQELGDAEGVQWAAAGILERGWTKDYIALQKQADGAVAEVESKLRKAGRDSEADQLLAAMKVARQRDLIVELTWSGPADLDLIVEEPNGTTCSFDSARTPNGGVLVHDGYGPDPKNTYEMYVCPTALAGEYRVRVKHITGNVVGKRAVLRFIRYQGTDHESIKEKVIEVGGDDKVFRITLNQGRRKELLPIADKPRQTSAKSPAGSTRMQVLQQLAGIRPQSPPRILAQQGGVGGGGFQPFVTGFNPVLGGGGTVGFQPVITTLLDGISLGVAAVVSADRRYVRLAVAPSFTTITGVDVFSFVGGLPQGGTGGAGGTGGGNQGAGGGRVP